MSGGWPSALSFALIGAVAAAVVFRRWMAPGGSDNYQAYESS